MPSPLNCFAHAVMGNGAQLSVDGVVIAECGTCAQWLTDTEVIAQVADVGWKVAKRLVVDRQPQGEWQVLDERGCNFLAAGGGLFQAYLSGPQQCFGSYGELGPSCTLGQIGTDGRGAAAPDGTIQIPVGPNGIRLLSPYGISADVPGIVPRDVQVIRAGQAIWQEGGTIGCVGIERPAQPGPIGRPRYVETDFGVHIVAWKDGVGLVVWHAPDASVGRIITSGVAHAHEAAWVNGKLVVKYSLGIQELPHELAGHDDVFALPVVPLTAPVAPIVPIGRAMWLGWHTGTPASTGGWITDTPPTSVPGNSYASILGAPEPHALIYDFAGNEIAVYTEGEVEGDVNSMEARIADARAKHPGLPVMIYWPQAGWHTVPSAEWTGVEAYWGKDESKDGFISRVLGAIQKVKAAGKKAVPIFHCFTSNAGLQQDLTQIPPIAAQLAHDHLEIDHLWVFNGTGRQTGLDDHPEVRPLWEQVFAGITGTPEPPEPEPPEPEPPEPEPPEPEEPVAKNPPYQLDVIERMAQQFPDLVKPYEHYESEQAACNARGEFTQRCLPELGDAYWGMVGKTGGEAQYVPPGFEPHDVEGNWVTGVAESVIYHSPSQTKNGQVQIVSSGGGAAWMIIDASYYRSNNPWMPAIPWEGYEPAPEPPEPDEGVYPEDKYNEFIDAAAKIDKKYFAIPLKEGRQGAREMGDRFRGQGVNPTVWELCTGPRMRTGGDHVATEVLDPAVAEALAEQERLE